MEYKLITPNDLVTDEEKRLAVKMVENTPAYLHFWQFVFGEQPTVTDKIIDDAFEAMLSKAKLNIEWSNLSQEEKEQEKQKQEDIFQSSKAAFRSQLKEVH